MTKDVVNKTVLAILLSEMIVADGDVDSPEVTDFVKAGKDIIYGNMGAIRAAAKKYMETGNRENLRLSLLPFHHMIRYEASSPYWLKHCYLIAGSNNLADRGSSFISKSDYDTEDFTYYNDLVDLHWAWRDQQWKSVQPDDQLDHRSDHQSYQLDQLDRKIRFALPPTKGLIQYQYQEVMNTMPSTKVVLIRRRCDA
jgi:hypothetical protein